MILKLDKFDLIESSPASGRPSPPLRVPRPARAALLHHLAGPALFAAAVLVFALFAPTTARAQTAPTITGIEFVSTPPQSQCGGRAYVEGDIIRVGVNFSEAVTVDTTSGTPKLALRMCGYDRDATLDTTSSGTSRLEFTRTVANDDWACDGQSPSFRSGALTVEGGTIRSSATQTDADLANAPVPRLIGRAPGRQPGAHRHPDQQHAGKRPHLRDRGDRRDRLEGRFCGCCGWIRTKARVAPGRRVGRSRQPARGHARTRDFIH